jgi:hypothetical protein
MEQPDGPRVQLRATPATKDTKCPLWLALRANKLCR